MKLLPLLVGATALTATTAYSGTIQLTLTYDNIQQRFNPDSDPFDNDNDASGFMYINEENTVGDGAIYGSQFLPPDDPSIDIEEELRQYHAADQMLQEIFDDQSAFGGATFDEEENTWIDVDVETKTVEFTITLDTDLFDLSQPFFTDTGVPTGDFEDFGEAMTAVSFISRDGGGGIIGAETLFSSVNFAAARNADVGDGRTSDVLGFGSSNDDVQVADDAYAAPADNNIGFFFANPDIDAADDGNNDGLTGDWFKQVSADGDNDVLGDNDLNALEYALSSSGFIRIFEYEEVWFGTDGNGDRQALGRNVVQGELRSFRVVTGEEDNPFLPTVVTQNDDGDQVFGFEVDVPEVEEGQIREPIWIDPDISVGYIYTVLDENDVRQEILGIQAPDFATVGDGDGYTLELLLADGTTKVMNIALGVGQKLLFAENQAVIQVTLTGIDESLMLNPENPALFQTGIITNASGLLTFTQTPITKFVPDETDVSAVPLPLPALMLLSGLAGLGALRGRKSKSL